MKILIADNDFESIEDMGITLNTYISELEFTTINSGKQCLKMIKEITPDALILGMCLCDMSGLQLIDQIRDDSDIPVIFISSDKRTETLITAFDKGANDYIIKPCNKKILIARLNALVRRSNWDMQIRKNKTECHSITTISTDIFCYPATRH
jgi:DNA-binding response OmpR family regulator